jgi:hypothetical protein
MKTAMENVTLGFEYRSFHRAGAPIVSLLNFFIYCSPVHATVHRNIAWRSGATGLQDRLAVSLTR